MAFCKKYSKKKMMILFCALGLYGDLRLVNGLYIRKPQTASGNNPVDDQYTWIIIVNLKQTILNGTKKCTLKQSEVL